MPTWAMGVWSNTGTRISIYRKILLTFFLPSLLAFECDQMFVSSPDGPKNGTFKAPLLDNPSDHSRQCLYTFLASEGERVQIRFLTFGLRGAHPECANEYIDMYMEIEDPTTDLINTPFGGRVCGRNIPKPRISMHKAFVAAFFTDERTVTPDLFTGYYEFIDAAQFIAGTPFPNEICSFIINSEQKREGEFLSPTYPGVYPKNLQCSYKFEGKKGQRVRLEFMDFDLFYGGSHCPFDFVKVFDGTSLDDPQIGIYCGQQRNLVVYSSTENLYVYFSTLPRTAYASNRGFTAWFEFSERFVSLDFIGKDDGEHIRGTECDQKILSKKESSGYVYSPNYPFPYHFNIVCRYYIYGMQDSQDLERVRIDFERFQIPTLDTECSDGNVKLYLQGQEERAAIEEFDHVFCGQKIPPSVLSEGPRLVMVFNSGSSQGPGFKAKYTFETDYKVPGTAAPNGSCTFTYTSDSRKTGEFNSPRHPANYPSSTVCEYIFKCKPNEQVKFVFNYFKTKTDILVPGYNDICTEDWLDIFELLPSGRERKIGRYCGKTAPGPVISETGALTLKAVLHTDDSGVASGFLATYTFLEGGSKFGDCGQNITGESSGVITSPGFPNQYQPFRQVCNWYISVRPHYKVLLHFNFFLIEGSPIERGCPGAVVRIWRDISQAPIELCGGDLTNDTTEIISASSILKLTFMTADKAVGSGGFKCTWTEIKEGDDCEQLTCPKSGHCISETLRCNGQMNCGRGDDSDELHCVQVETLDLYLIAGLASAGSILLLLTLCLVCHRKRKRRRHHPPPFDPYRPKPPREVPGLQFVSVDSV